jgi:hypothetical protein
MAPAQPRRKRPLREVLAYRNDEVVERFLDAWQVTPAEARLLFDDLKRYLWLVADDRCARIPPILIIDEMWHTFIVYTVDYRAFGERYFGAMMEHVPTTHLEKEERARRAIYDPEGSLAAYERRLTDELELVHDALGPTVLKRWYVEYRARYDETFFATQRRTAPRAVPARSPRRTGTTRRPRRRTSAAA